jgi:hypothetical protein
MMKNFVWVVISLFIASGLASCGGGSSSSNASTTPLAITGTSGNAVDMNGTWKGCQRNDQDQQDLLISAAINGSGVTVTGSIWSAPTTANCQQTAGPDAVFTEVVTLSAGAQATATWTDGMGSTLPPSGISASAKATQITMAYQSATMTVNSASWVTNFNNGAFCGKTDWQVGVPVNVLNCTDIVSSTTETNYWVVDDSSAPLKLYMQDIATAPYQVDSINPLVKQ